MHSHFYTAVWLAVAIKMSTTTVTIPPPGPTRTSGRAWPTLERNLSPKQRSDVESLWRQYSTVINEKPGRTSVAEHRISTAEAQPIRLPPYRIPHAYREIVRTELEEMERESIISRSASEWTAPIVLVKKKDGTLRMCIDYRRLNSISNMDAYPMPRVDDDDEERYSITSQ